MPYSSSQLAELLEGWKQVAHQSASGPGFDLTESNPATRFDRTVDAFLDDPCRDTFEQFWTEDTLLDARVRTAGLVLNRWEDTVEGVAALIEEMRDSETYDPAWESKLPGQTAWEVYSRFHVAESPIVSSHVRSALKTLGFDPGSDYVTTVDAAETLASEYESVVGHATAETDHEVHPHVELEQLLLVVGGLDGRTATTHATGEFGPLFRPLVGLRSRDRLAGGKISLRDADGLLDAYARARNNRAYRDEDTDDWGGNHYEQWKWNYHDHLRTELDGVVVTGLESEDVEALFDAYEYTTSWGATAPHYLLGTQWGTYAWRSVRDVAERDPTEAAEVFSHLFEVADTPYDRAALDSRLAWFEQTFETDSASGGTLLSVATLFLAFYDPENYVLYRHNMMQTFFERYTDYDFADGYDRRHYRLVNAACHDLADELTERMDEAANLLDVHTLFWVLHRQGPP